MSDEQLKAEDNGGAFDDGGGAAADVDAAAAEGEDDGEAALFAELTASRAAGTRFDAMSKDDEGKADGGGAGKADGKPGEGAADGKPGEGAADGKPGEGEGAPADGKPGEGAADGKPGEGAAAGGTDLTGDVAGLRDLLVDELGDLEVAPAEDGEAAVTFKDLAQDYPGITTAMVAIVARLTAPLRAQYEQQQYTAGRERLLGDLEAELPGARALADSPEFAAWFGKQPDGVKQLGQSPAVADAGKILKLYLAENPQAKRAAAQGAGDEAKRRRLAVLAAGSGGGSGAAPRGGRAIERAGVSEFVDEDEAEAEFERLAAERRTQAAK